MQRSLTVIVLALGIGLGLLAASHAISQRVCARHLARSTDDLEWLRLEFRLGPAELARIRQLHEGYQPRCQEMCTAIAKQKRDVELALAAATNATVPGESIKAKLEELASLRARCQMQMLQHFAEVSQAMPPDQGRRYLSEMQRITLGFHEQIEQSMADSPGHAHGNH